MSDFLRGDTVRFSATAKVVFDSTRHGLTVRLADNTTHFVSFSKYSVELLERPVKTPENWPPLPDDVWEGKNGHLFHTVDADTNLYPHNVYLLKLTQPRSDFLATDEFIQKYGPLKLIFRKESNK